MKDFIEEIRFDRLGTFVYSDEEGRKRIALAFNDAVKSGKISAPIVLGRDHHDVSGTDSPFRETANIYDGSQFTADMAIHNVIGVYERSEPNGTNGATETNSRTAYRAT